MKNSTPITPAISSNDLHASFTLHYTSYSGWSGKVYGKGRVSGVSASPVKRDVVVERVTAKAVMFKSNGQSVWIPISRLTVQADGSLVVNRGFCYFTGGLSWQVFMPQRSANGMLGGTAVYSPYRKTVL